MSNETTLDDVLALPGKWQSEADPKAARLLHPDACEALNGAADELEALLPAIKAALEDARRLDWLGAGDDRDCYVAMDGRWTVQVGATFFGGDTLRAAIDAAQEVG